MRRSTVAGALAALALLGVSCETLEVSDLLRTGTGGELSLETIVSGLKEALKVGTERTVSLTSAVGGYFDNERIRIGTPEKLDKVASGLRKIGLGSYVDELELTMNRAAEQAAVQAKSVFWDAVTQMSFEDAKGILHGSDTAATDYFREKTSGRLRELYAPIVTRTMSEVGAVRAYDDLMARYATIPFVPKPEMSLEDYVTDKALDGLFTVLADEEQKIRRNPAARTTELLRKVFG